MTGHDEVRLPYLESDPAIEARPFGRRLRRGLVALGDALQPHRWTVLLLTALAELAVLGSLSPARTEDATLGIAVSFMALAAVVAGTLAGPLVGSLAAGKMAGLKPRARILGAASIGSEPSIMLTGPSYVTEKLLKKLGMGVNDIDLYELNEAFAAVVLRYMQALDISHDKMNVCGGAIAMGHPLGATGAMILGTLVDELERSGKSTGLAVLCVGGGMATATVVERI